MSTERGRTHGLSPWLPLWCLVGATSLLALLGGGHLLNELWLLDVDGAAALAPALLLALVVAPLPLVPLTVGRRPGTGSWPVVILCLAIAALGVVAQKVIAATHASDGAWYTGPGGFDPLA